MKPDKAWFIVGTKSNPRMKEAVRNAHMVLKGAGVVERGTCAIKDGTRLATLAFYDVVSGRKIGERVI